MDVVKQIEIMRKAHNWSVYKLAVEAGMTQSTLSNMYSRGTLPSIHTLSCICDAFGITLSQFFIESGEPVLLSRDEEILIKDYQQLSIKDRTAVKILLSNLK